MKAGGDTKELQLFREEWKKQVSEENADAVSSTGNGSGRSCQLRQTLENDLGGNQNHLEYHLFENVENKISHTSQPKNEDSVLNTKETEPILFYFPEPGDTHPASANKQQLQTKAVDCTKNNQKSLVDQLIEDIDEITSIPFFDLSLPREVGIIIFSDLSVKDLCAAAQVSKSWKVLSEDGLIWRRLGCKLGYIQNHNQTVIDKTNWKHLVRDKILKDRDLRKNWKERICRLSSMDFERGGTLCTVSVCGNFVCSGYSTGTVVVWEVDSEGNTSYKQLTAEFENEGQKPWVTSTAVSEKLCSAGYYSGDVHIWQRTLSSFPLCHVRCDGPVRSVSISSSGQPALAAASDHELKVQVSDSNGQWLCLHSRNFEDRLCHVKFIPNSLKLQTESVSAATVNKALVLTPGSECVTYLDHVIGGKITCMDCTADRLALGVGSYGYGTLGNKVRLYCLETAKMLSVLRGHYREITCLDLANCPPHRLVTGCHDCRVRVFDLRSEQVAFSFHLGQNRIVSAVQMDDWKVVSGAEDGTLLVWDQRMASTLWMTHARHPVKLCRFSGPRLFTANIPLAKMSRENMWYADDLILHRRHRGIVRFFDFSVNNSTQGIPDICSSNYDDTSGYNYNINLSVPYDKIEK